MEKKKPLNATQLKYALTRVDSIKRVKLSEIEKKHTIEGVELSRKQKLDLIYSDNPPPRLKRNEVGIYTDLWEAYDFSDIEKDPIINKEAIEFESNIVAEEAERLKDELVFLDGPEVVDKLNKW